MCVDVCFVVKYFVIRLTIPVVKHLKGEIFLYNSSDISSIGIFIEFSYTGFDLTSSLLLTVVKLNLYSRFSCLCQYLYCYRVYCYVRWYLFAV